MRLNLCSTFVCLRACAGTLPQAHKRTAASQSSAAATGKLTSARPRFALSICLRELERAYSDLLSEVGQGVPASAGVDSSAAAVAHAHAVAQLRCNGALDKIAWTREALVHQIAKQRTCARLHISAEAHELSVTADLCAVQHQTAPQLESLLKFATGQSSSEQAAASNVRLHHQPHSALLMLSFSPFVTQ